MHVIPDCAYCNASYIGGALMHEHSCKRPQVQQPVQGIAGTSTTATNRHIAALGVALAAMSNAAGATAGYDAQAERIRIDGRTVLDLAKLAAIAQAVLDAG